MSGPLLRVQIIRFTAPASILPQALKTTYHVTDKYIEVDIDVSANSVANYATGMCRGSANSLVIDMGEADDVDMVKSGRNSALMRPMRLAAWLHGCMA